MLSVCCWRTRSCGIGERKAMRVERKKPMLYATQQHEYLSIKDKRKTGDEEEEDDLGFDISAPGILQSWRVRDRMKTVSVALVLCLNVGVDPPGVVKPNPCAKLECWIDPLSMQPQRALDTIGKYLQQQYERWQPRARYKVSPDPTSEEVRKLCTALRRNAKDERVLFHYNGHGVPIPTHNGEVWVFNRSYTQYIPLSIYDLQMWMGTPSIYVFDCSAAELVVSSFKTFAQHREREQEELSNTRGISSSPGADDPAVGTPNVSYKECILLAACAANEILPTNPDLPADLFTSCLTTPIKMALRWFAPRSLLGIGVEKLDRIPGRLNDRKTPLGELNWIFTAITDTIAWNVLPRDLFKRLFRQDLLVASLFRNFLLAERIMWTVNCTPVSEPKLPSTHSHPLWQAWDYTVEQCLAQLPSLLAAEEASSSRAKSGLERTDSARPQSGTREEGGSYSMNAEAGMPSDTFQYTPNTFFEDQMTAFEVWLAMGPEADQPPEQLPIVLQVLLSQAHRLRALKLLAKFLQIGAWAIDHALSVGIFPYVLKLLQSQIPELRRELVFIWGKVLALDTSCVLDLVKENGQVHFIDFLTTAQAPPVYLAMSAFVISVIASKFPDQLEEVAVINACVGVFEHEHPLVRRWACLCIGRLVEERPSASINILMNVEILSKLKKVAETDTSSDARASALNALVGVINSTMQRLCSPVSPEEGATVPDPATRETEQMALLSLVDFIARIVDIDASPLARREVALGLHQLLEQHAALFQNFSETNTFGNFYRPDIAATILFLVVTLRNDPHPIIAGIAAEACSFVEFLGPQTSPSGESKESAKRPQAETYSQNISTPTPTDAGHSDSFPFSQFLEAILPNGASHEEETPRCSFNSVPFVNAGADSFLLDPVNSLPSIYSIFCRSVINVRYDGAEHLEPFVREEKVGVCFAFAKKHLFRPKAEGQWSSVDVSTLTKKLVETQVLPVGAGEIWTSAFLPLDPYVVTGDQGGVVSMWNTDTGRMDTQFGIPRRRSAHVCGMTSLDILEGNAETPIIAAGAADGVISIWTCKENMQKQRIVSTWRASTPVPGALLSDSLQAGYGLKTCWNPSRCELIASGCEGGTLRAWNVESETCTAKIQVLRGETTTAVDVFEFTHFIGGSAGSVVLYDARSPGPSFSFTDDSRVATQAPIVSVQHQSLGSDVDNVLSADADGVIRIWDVRAVASPILSTKPVSDLTAFVAHPQLRDVIALSSGLGEVMLIDYEGRTLRELRYHEGFLSQRISPVTCLSLHPKLPILAVGYADSMLSLFEQRI